MDFSNLFKGGSIADINAVMQMLFNAGKNAGESEAVQVSKQIYDLNQKMAKTMEHMEDFVTDQVKQGNKTTAKQFRELLKSQNTFKTLAQKLGASNVEEYKALRKEFVSLFRDYNVAMKKERVSAMKEDAYTGAEKGFIAKRGRALRGVYRSNAGSGFQSIGQMVMAGKAALAPIGALIANYTLLSNQINSMMSQYGFRGTNTFQRFAQFNSQNVARGGLSSNIQRFGVQTALQQTLGTEVTGDIGIGTLDTIAGFSKTIGLAQDESVQLLNTLKGITGESVEANTSFLKNIVQVASSYGVGYKQIFEDLKSNAEFFAQYAGVGRENLVRASIAARRLGLEFGTVSKVLGSLNQLDSVIEKQMQLSLFTGKQFDLMTVATLNYQGETEKAQSVLLKQVRDINDEAFNNPFVRGKLSEQLGVSVTELVKMRQNARSLGGEFNRVMEINDRFDKRLDDFNKIFSSVGMARIKDAIDSNILAPLSNLFGLSTQGGEGITKGIVSVLNTIATPLRGMLQLLSNMSQTGQQATVITGSLLASTGILISRFTTGNLAQVRLLSQIRDAIVYGEMKNRAPSAFGNFMSGKGGKFLKGAGKIAGASLIPILTGVGQISEGNNAGLIGNLVGTGLGAGAGFFLGGPMGAMIGANIGSGLGSIIGDSVGMQSGGIVPAGYPNDTFRANLTSGEAVIPLDSGRGQEAMANLIDYDKMAKAFQRANIKMNIVINNKTDKRESFYDGTITPNSSLAFG